MKGAVLRALAGAALAVLATTALAQADFPNRPVTFLIPQAVGGSTDVMARTVGQRLGDALGQGMVMDNRAGANGIIGTEVVAKAPPTGYLLLVGGTGTMSINPSLYEKLPYDPVRQFTPVALLGYSTSVLVVHPSMAVNTITDLIAQAKAKPGAIRYASAGVGSSPHLTAELFQNMTGVEVLHVPYKGSTPGVTATIAGETQMMFTGVASSIGHIKSGRLKPVSITGPRRSAALPGVPTAGESGLPGFEADFWIGIFAPAGTPRAVVLRLNTEINKILATESLRERFGVIGVDPLPITPEQFGEIVARDTERWAKTARAMRQ